MKRIGQAALLTAAALAVSGCTVRQYMGISTRTPVTAEEQARLDAALAGPAVAAGCPWSADDAKPVNVPCDSLPLPRLAMLAGMDHKAALQVRRPPARRDTPPTLLDPQHPQGQARLISAATISNVIIPA